MNNKVFIRKIIYLVGIVVLLFVIPLLSSPSTMAALGDKGNPGGWLARKRDEYKISQANLGEIDPAGETMKLASLGMRGVAAYLLWQQADEYKKREDWTGLKASLEQITKLQPNFVAVWRYQAWNLSYNVSVEFDDYKDRYYWVIRGIRFLEDGSRLNQHEPRLIADTGWFVGHKIGQSDEHLEFRKLFRADRDFHGNRPERQRDNWLVAQEYYARADAIVKADLNALRTLTPVLFYSEPAMFQMNLGAALEEEGTFGEVAREAWVRGMTKWRGFGNKSLPTYIGQFLSLNDLDTKRVRHTQLLEKLENLQPGLREKMLGEIRANWSDAEREAMEVSIEQRDESQMRLASMAMVKLNIPHRDVAERVEKPKRAKALKLAESLDELQAAIQMLEKDRETTNYDYWARRSKMESELRTVEAREHLYLAMQAFANGELEQSREQFELGFKAWRPILDVYTEMVKANAIANELADQMQEYNRLLKQMDSTEEFPPADFPLMDVVEGLQPDQQPQGMAIPEGAIPEGGLGAPQ